MAANVDKEGYWSTAVITSPQLLFPNIDVVAGVGSSYTIIMSIPEELGVIIRVVS